MAALIWLVIVFAAYFAGHKPFTPGTAVAVVRSVAYLLAALAVLSLAGGLGRRLLPVMDDSPLESMALQAALGLGILSATILVLGATLGLSSYLAWGCGILLAIFRSDVFAWWRSWAGLAQVWQAGGRMGKCLGILSLLILCATLLVALAPPLKFDSLVYHLALPAAYIQAGRVEYLPWNVFWGMPQLAEILYTWSMLLAGGVSALSAGACLGWMAGVVALVGMLGLASRRLGSLAAWVAVASLLAGATAATELGWGYVEWFTVLYGVAFLTALEHWQESRRLIWLLWCGVTGGMAFSSKYSAAALLLAGFALVAWRSLREAGWRRGVFNSGIMLLGAAAAASPWLMKNILATGNPLYPFLLPGGAMDDYRLELYQGVAVWGDWRAALLLPWEATITGYEGAPGFGAAVGPLLLGLGLIYLLRRWMDKPPEAGAALPMALLGLLIWAVAGRLVGLLIQTRLYMAFLPAFAMLAAGGFCILAELRLPGVRLGRVAGSLVVLALGFTTLQVGIEAISRGASQALVGVRSTEEYLSANLGWHVPAMQQVRDLPDGSMALMLWEPRGLYCLPRCHPDEILDRWLRDYRVYGSPEAVLSAWQLAGYTHLLVYRAGMDFVRQDDRRYTPAVWQALDALLAKLPAPLETGEAYSLYTLIP